jgi:phage-related minor tail protein
MQTEELKRALYPAEVEEAVSAELSALAVKQDARKAKQAGKTLTVVTSEALQNVGGSADAIAEFIKKWEKKFKKWDKVVEDLQDTTKTKQVSKTSK